MPLSTGAETAADRTHRMHAGVQEATPAARFRVVHLVSSLQVGGMERFVLRIARSQQDAGHRVSVLALQGGPLEVEAGRLRLPVRVLGGRNRLARAVRGAWHLALCRPDILHAHNPSSLHYAVLGKRVSGAAVVMTFHGEGKGGTRLPAPSEWEATDAVVAVSHAATESLRSPGARSRLHVILNGVSPEPPARDWEAVRRELGLEDRFVVVQVARIDPLKGHGTLIRAIAALRDRGLPVIALLVGDGPERDAMTRLAAELGLGPDRVRFLGFRADVPDLLAAADAFALPSVTEGLPLSVLEAMAHRLPVVVTPVGGIPELVEEGRHGLYVPVGDAEALAAALARLAGDPALRRALGEAGFRRVREEFSFERMTRDYDLLYQRLRGR